jgi:flagellar biosynthetic protein FliP
MKTFLPLRSSLRFAPGSLILLLLCLTLGTGWSQATGTNHTPDMNDLINVSINTGKVGSAGGANLSTTIQILVLMTILSLAPAIVIMTTSFVRIIIVLSFLRQALTLQVPPNQVIMGLALFMTYFIMQPTWDRITNEAIVPVRENKITFDEGINRAVIPMKTFMLKYVTEADLRLFLSMSATPIELTTPDALPLQIIVPAYMLSELKKGFQMGLLILMPFLVIDMVVASILMALGMMMLPPPTVSLPIKLMVFVVVDGWTLIIRSLLESFRV